MWIAVMSTRIIYVTEQVVFETAISITVLPSSSPSLHFRVRVSWLVSIFTHHPFLLLPGLYCQEWSHLFIFTLLPKLNLLASHLLYQWPPPLIPIACLFPAWLKGAFWARIICCLQLHSSYWSSSGLPSEHSSTKTSSAGRWNCCEEGFEHRPTPHIVSRHQSAGDTHSEALEAFITPPHVHQVNEFGEVKRMSPPCGGKLKWLVMAIESVLHFTTINQNP